MGIKKIFIDIWMKLCAAGDVLRKSRSREEFCSQQGAEMLNIANAGICVYSLLQLITAHTELFFCANLCSEETKCILKRKNKKQ